MSDLDLVLRKRRGQESRERTTAPPVQESRERTTAPPVQESSPTPKSIDRLTVEAVMSKFLEKDPKIGVWSHPSFLVLQYLYNTVPGFKIGKVAKDAMERGLREMYPELFSTAEEIVKRWGT